MEASRLLIVHDDPFVRTLLSQIATLDLRNVLVETTDSPHTVLECLETTAYDTVITDVVMPGTNGIDLTRRIHAISPFTPVVIMSGAADLFDHVRSSDIFGYIVKPIDPDAFVRMVEAAILYGRQQRCSGEEPDYMELTLYRHCFGD